MNIPLPLNTNRTGWPWQAPDQPALSGTWPRITIVTPSYNQADFIEETIRSVLLQGYPNLEYFVMDGGSSDGTVEILRHYQDHLHWVSEKDRGQSDAINKGLRQATGDIIAYINSDDFYEPGAFETVARIYQALPTVGLIYGDTVTIWADGREKGVIQAPPLDVKAMIHKATFLPQQSTFWTRHAQEVVGLMDQSEHWGMDMDFFIRLAQQFEGVRVPKKLARFRFHDSSKSVTSEHIMWKSIFRLSERYGLRPYHAWWWMRLAKHYGLRAMPASLQMMIRRRLNRPADAVLVDTNNS